MRDKTLSDSLWHGELSIVLLIRYCDLQKFNFSFIGCLRTSGEEVQNHNQPPKLLNSMATSFSAILTQNTHFWQRLSTGKLDDHHLLEGTIWAIIFVLVIFLLVYRTYLYFWGLTFRSAHSCCESQSLVQLSTFSTLAAQFIQPHLFKLTYLTHFET